MGKSPAKWVKSILRGRKSSKSYPSKKAADDNEAPTPPQASSKELASPSTPIEVNSELGQARSTRASYENDNPVTANQTNEMHAAEFKLSKEAENLGLDNGATEVQAALPGFMASKTYHSTKGIIRLQALVRGHLVRRQALATLHCVRGIVKFQAVARGRKIRSSFIGLEVRKQCSYQKVDVSARSSFSSSTILGKQSSNAFASKILASSISALPLNIQYDPDEPNSAPKWLERWSASHFWGSAAHQKVALGSNSQQQGNKTVRAESSVSADQKHEARKAAATNVESSLLHSSVDSGKPKRNSRKHLAQHVETVQDHPEHELERVKRSLRKISLNNKETPGKSEPVVEIPKRTAKFFSVSPAPDARTPRSKSEAATEELNLTAKNISVSPAPNARTPRSKSEAATEELNLTALHNSSSEVLDAKENILSDSIMDESNPSDSRPQKPEMETELESLMVDEPVDLSHNLSAENGVDDGKYSLMNEEKVSKEENYLEYDNKSQKRSIPAKEYSENTPQNTRTVPSYMAATQSAKAKLRGLGSPKLAGEGEEDAPIRRHSLPSSTNGKLSSMSPRVQKVVGHANGKDRTRSDKSLTSSRDGHGKVLRPDWRR